MQDDLDGHLPQHESWRCILRALEDETIFFKTKLAYILSKDFERSHLRHLEIFQHRFLIMDEQVKLLRHELIELQEFMQKNKQTSHHSGGDIVLQETLAAKIYRIQESFDTLASDFRMYLDQFFPYI